MIPLLVLHLRSPNEMIPSEMRGVEDGMNPTKMRDVANEMTQLAMNATSLTPRTVLDLVITSVLIPGDLQAAQTPKRARKRPPSLIDLIVD
jgi:hypothetical protein